jgi:hypothetical protein
MSSENNLFYEEALDAQRLAADSFARNTTMTIERIGTTAGRFARYRLIVNGHDLGTVRRKVVKGKDGNAGRRQPAYDVWAIHGTECATQAQAEATMIRRAATFGKIVP